MVNDARVWCGAVRWLTHTLRGDFSISRNGVHVELPAMRRTKGKRTARNDKLRGGWLVQEESLAEHVEGGSPSGLRVAGTSAHDAWLDEARGGRQGHSSSDGGSSLVSHMSSSTVASSPSSSSSSSSSLPGHPSRLLCHARIVTIGDVDLAKQTFHSRVDFTVIWNEQVEGGVEYAKEVAEAHRMGQENRQLKWEPLLRFPNAVHYEIMNRTKLYLIDEARRRVGFRTTVQGVFKCKLDLSKFPFDVQALRLDVQLGFEMNSKQQLFADTHVMVQNPEEANLINAQIDSEYTFRPIRFCEVRAGGAGTM